MDELRALAALVSERNRVCETISALIGRPAEIGHLGEYIASPVFGIRLEQSAANKGHDGRFTDGPMAGRTVNIKWYTQREGSLDIHEMGGPDYYLALTGPKAPAASSRGCSRPWRITAVYLFESKTLLAAQQARGARLGTAASVPAALWQRAQIYPECPSGVLTLSARQREMLRLFA